MIYIFLKLNNNIVKDHQYQNLKYKIKIINHNVVYLEFQINQIKYYNKMI